MFFPYEYAESVFTIDYQKLYDLGYRGLLFDIDNTLVPHGADSTPEVDALMAGIHAVGFRTLMLSNNSEERIQRFLKNIDSLYINEAGKPNPEAYLRAVKMLGLKKEQVLCIGDQVFTDVFGANRCGMANILVKYIGFYEPGRKGKRRAAESMILRLWKLARRFDRKGAHRIGSIELPEGKAEPAGASPDDAKDVPSQEGKMTDKQKTSVSTGKKKKKERVLFCDINPTTYAISVQKEVIRRDLKDLIHPIRLASERRDTPLPVLVYSHDNGLIKRGKGIDPVLQENKAININLSCARMNKLIIHPGESFSFWRISGKPTKRRGYKDGRVIIGNRLRPGLGGGLCNLANTIHLLILHSPLEVTEFHSHSDALAPDPNGVRVPFSAGTSVSYNYIDYRFRNNTDQDFQLLLWCENERLYGELRCEKELPYTYRITEEDHHFHKEGDKYYRISRIYKETLDRTSGEVLQRELVLKNHSEVMFDYDMIPKELIR